MTTTAPPAEAHALIPAKQVEDFEQGMALTIKLEGSFSFTLWHCFIGWSGGKKKGRAEVTWANESVWDIPLKKSFTSVTIVHHSTD